MNLIPDGPPGKICPLHKEDMSRVCRLCPWWTQLRGKHPVTNSDIDEWACAITFLPILLIENSKETRQAAAGIDMLRNEVDQSNNRMSALLSIGMNGSKMLGN